MQIKNKPKLTYQSFDNSFLNISHKHHKSFEYLRVLKAVKVGQFSGLINIIIFNY